MGELRVFFLIAVLMLFGVSLSAQPPDSLNTTVVADSLAADSLGILPDSLSLNGGKTANDSPIKSEVHYKARDSMVYDVEKGLLKLYGESSVKYEKIELKAARIDYSFQNYRVHANGVTDTAGKPVGEPVFTDGGSTYDAHSMDYNFRSKKGIVRTVQTKVPQGYLTGKKVKTTQNNKVLYVKDASFCPCEDPEAHTRFKISRLKLIKDEQIIAGPGYLSFYDIPVPIAFPFGFFPSVDKQQAGLIIPSYGDSDEYGLFLQGLGFYMPLGENWDTQLTSDIYARGSLRFTDLSRYKKRYRYSGSFKLDYSLLKSGDRDLNTFSQERSFFIRWNHSQASQANPFSTFSANVNAGSSNNFRSDLSTSQDNFLQGTFSSGINYSRNFPGSPFRLSLNATHSQNIRTRVFTISAPNANLAMQRIRPFKDLGGPGGGGQWYKNFGLSYNLQFRNELQVPESALRLNNLDSLRRQFRNGVTQTASLSNSFNVGYFSLNPKINATERWYFRTIEKHFDEETQTVITDTIPGFERELEYRGGASLTTKIYGMYAFKNEGWLRAIRHTFTPTFSFSVSPDFDPSRYGFYGEDGALQSYSPYDGSVIGQPGAGSRANLSVSLVNSLEGKIFNRNDTASAINRINILDNFSLRGNYNFLADSLNLSDIGLSARTRVLNMFNITFSSSFSPYDVDNRGRSIDRFLIQSGRLAQMNRMQLSIGGNLTGGNGSAVNNDTQGSSPKGGLDDAAKKEDLGAGSSELPEEDQDFMESLRGAFVDFTVPWNLNFTYSLRQNNQNKPLTTGDGELLPGGGYERVTTTTQSVQFTGDLRLFKKIMLSVQSGYDFTQHEFTTTTLNVNVDLNCWELRATIIPTGIRKSYSVGLNIKSNILRDLKIQRRGNLGSTQNYY